MAKSVSCPKCSAPLSAEHLTADGEVVCPKCGSRFRTKPRSATTPAPEARKPAPEEEEGYGVEAAERRAAPPATPKKKKKGAGKRKNVDTIEARGRMLARVLIGGVALVVLVGGVLLVRGLLKPGADGRPQ